jgi:archaellum component FlaC
MGANQSGEENNVENNVDQEQIDKCINDYGFSIDMKNDCCNIIEDESLRNNCVDHMIKKENAARNIDQRIKNNNSSIESYRKEAIREGFIEGNTVIADRMDDARIRKEATLNSLIASQKAKGYSKAANDYTIKTNNIKDETNNIKNKANNIKDETNNIKNKANNLKNQTNDLKNQTNNIKNQTNNLRNQTSDLKNETYNLRNQTKNIKTKTNDLKDETNDLKDEAENDVITINQRVDDTNDLVDDTREVLHGGIGGLIGSQDTNAKQMNFDQNLSAYVTEKIDFAKNSLESFIGSKKEGFSRKEIYDLLSFLKTKEEAESVALQENINQRLEESTYDLTGELLSQKDNILTRLIFDYMINDETGTNVEKVYKDLKQKNNDELRKIQIKSYYNKAYKEYIFILKVVICLIVLLIPIIFLNKYEYIDNNKTLTSIAFIITIGVLFISYRLYLLYMKDDIDYDRIRVPYDRQTSELIKQGKMKSKGSVLKNLGVTCVGDECCDVSMVYDNLNNKCVLSENFGGYFESMQNKNKETFNIIEPYTFENFTTLENVTSKKEGLLRDSLVRSSNKRM